jgi:hypothetical protein
MCQLPVCGPTGSYAETSWWDDDKGSGWIVGNSPGNENSNYSPEASISWPRYSGLKALMEDAMPQWNKVSFSSNRTAGRCLTMLLMHDIQLATLEGAGRRWLRPCQPVRVG